MSHYKRESEEGGDKLFVIGLGIGPVGRWFRLFLGAYLLVFLVLNPLYLHPLPARTLATFALMAGAYFLLIAVIYFVVFFLLGEPVLSRLNPWAGTVVFVGIPTALALLGVFPPALQMAFGFYVGGSLILIFFMRYGGCEVVALPSLLLRRRFTVYCPYNAIDAIERAVTPDKDWTRHRFFTIASLAIVIFVGGYFILVESNNLLGRYGVAFHIDNRWSLLLLVPCAQLAALALKHYRAGHMLFAPKVRQYGLGAVILALAIIAFIFEGAGVSADTLWIAAMVLGALLVILQFSTRLARRLKLRRQSM